MTCKSGKGTALLFKLHSVLRMSLRSVCYLNASQQKNTSPHYAKFLRFYSRISHGEVLDGRASSSSRSLSRKTINWKSRLEGSRTIVRHSQSIGSSAFIQNHGDIRQIEPIQSINIQQNVARSSTNSSATIFAFDIETTGLSRKKDRIIEFACRDLQGGKNSSLQSLVNPEQRVGNADIHGIKTEDVWRPDVPSFKDFFGILKQYVASRQRTDKVLMIAHNGHTFDAPFLINECLRTNEEIPSNWFFLCTVRLARSLVNSDGSKRNSISLESLRERYSIVSDEKAHRAMRDVNILSLVLQGIVHEQKFTVADLLEKALPASYYIDAATKAP